MILLESRKKGTEKKTRVRCEFTFYEIALWLAYFFFSQERKQCYMQIKHIRVRRTWSDCSFIPSHLTVFEVYVVPLVMPSYNWADEDLLLPSNVGSWLRCELISSLIIYYVLNPLKD
jgi:hypothetical protein